MANKRRFSNFAQQRRGRRLWSLIKSKLSQKQVEELTIDEYDVPVESEQKKWIVSINKHEPSESEKMQDELEPICPLFTEVDQDARYERHIKPIRELQAQNDKVLKPKEEL